MHCMRMVCFSEVGERRSGEKVKKKKNPRGNDRLSLYAKRITICTRTMNYIYHNACATIFIRKKDYYLYKNDELRLSQCMCDPKCVDMDVYNECVLILELLEEAFEKKNLFFSYLLIK